MAEPALKRRRHVSSDASLGLDSELAKEVSKGIAPSADPMPAAMADLCKTLVEIIEVSRWGEVFDASVPCDERCRALDEILDMPAAYEALGSDFATMKKHIYDLTHKLLQVSAQEKGFTFTDAIEYHDKYNVRGMCGAIAAARNIHLGRALSVDALCARAPYTAVSMYLKPSLCKLADKVVYERPNPKGTTASFV